MTPVEILLTDELALKARLAIDSILADENYVMDEDEEADYMRLAVFLGQVAAHPAQFRPQGKNAVRARSIVRKARGAAQPQSRRNRRKVRQKNRQGYAKYRRRHRRAMVENFNQAREAYEADLVIANEAAEELARRIEGQPKFDVINVRGETILAGVPAEFIKNEDGEPVFPKLIVPR